MRLSVTKYKNGFSLYVIKSVYKNGVRSTKVVEKLGTDTSLREKLKGQDPFLWAKEYIEKLNRQEKEQTREVLVKYCSIKQITKDEQHLFNGGYLFLQNIYRQLGLNNICRTISKKYRFAFNLDAVLSRLIYGRIIFPSSKKATYELAQKFIEKPDFELQHVYRALEIMAQETAFIQSELYRNSTSLSERNTAVLYYDCTNYFFETEQEEGLKQYGHSKEFRPNPIVQMGLFMDGDGIPLAFSIHKGNTNEQTTLKPLEKKILSDFGLDRFVVCTDAGVSKVSNRAFNNCQNRGFIVTQSLKKLKEHLRTWALDPGGYRLAGDSRTYDIHAINEEEHKDSIFCKERWINEDGLEQRLIVTYSVKYRDYQRRVRDCQINRACKLVDSNPGKITKVNQNDCRRFIAQTSYTDSGEIAEHLSYSVDESIAAGEAVYDGLYGICTNLEDEAALIAKINKRRWMIEECFRIMKSEFKARPVYLSRDDRITAHFTTCFLSLVIYRLLERKLGDKFTYCQIIDGLRSMNFCPVPGEGYLPAYTRNDFTDALHDAFGFRTDYQILTDRYLKKIVKDSKK